MEREIIIAQALKKAVEAEQQIRRTQVVEMQRVRLQDLPVVHQAPQFLGGRRQAMRTDDHIERLGRRQVVADRTDAS